LIPGEIVKLGHGGRLPPNATGKKFTQPRSVLRSNWQPQADGLPSWRRGLERGTRHQLYG